MKLLKGLLYVIVVLGLVFVVGGFGLPSSTHVERSITIQRSAGDVHAMLDSYQRFNQWSPWYEMDPQARYEISGPTAGVGASLAWTGDKIGSGSQRVVESVPGQKVVNALDFRQQGGWNARPRTRRRRPARDLIAGQRAPTTTRGWPS